MPSFVADVGDDVYTVWTVCLASCPVPSCGKRDGGHSKGLRVGPRSPTPYFPGASDSASCHILKVLLNLKYAIVMALFLTTEPVAVAFRNIFGTMFSFVFSLYVLMVFMDWECP